MTENTVRKSDKALELSEKNTLTTSFLAGELDISIYNAGNILKRLSKYGHLKRTQNNFSFSNGEKSGRYFTYTISGSGKNRLEWLRENGRLDGKVVAFKKNKNPP